MSLFRALKAKLFPSSQTSRDPKDIQLQTESPVACQEQALTQAPSVAVPLFQRHFSLKIYATKADATACEENADHNLTLYHYDAPQAIELLGWENANECCEFHHTEFDRLEMGNQLPFPEQHFWLGTEKVCSITAQKNHQETTLWQAELNNREDLLISHFTLDADYKVQGDIQDYASLTGQLHRTYHQLDSEDGAGMLRIVTQTPNLTEAVDSNYFGERHGVSRQFDALGTLLFEGNFINDQQLGQQAWYDHEGNITQSEERSTSGILVKRYYSNGQVREDAELDRDGNYVNTLSRYYESGKCWLTRPMLANKIHGIEYMYYECGALQAELSHEHGNLVKEVWFHPNGQLKQKILVNDAGKSFETFFENGQLSWREQFNPQGLIYGIRQEWHPNGQLALQLNFDNGLAQGNREKWYANGQLEAKIPFEQGKEQGMAYWYHDNGQLSLEMYLEKGLREGLFKSYYKSGVLSAEGQYKNNLSVAPFIEYYENQQVQMYLPHTQGNRDGTARWFYQDGTIRTISEYEVRDGQGYLRESSFYNKKGVLESYQSHSNTRCGYHLENNQREYYQEGIADIRIEYYEDGAIRWLLTRTQGDLFSSKSLSPQGLILETGTIQIIDGRYLDVGHWQRFTPQGQVYREVWLDEEGQLIESRHYFDANQPLSTQEDDEAEWDNAEPRNYGYDNCDISDYDESEDEADDFDYDRADWENDGLNQRSDNREHSASHSSNSAYLSRNKYHRLNGDTTAKQAQTQAAADVDAKEPILSYHLKFDDESKLYSMKRYHPNSHIAEEGNLQIQGEEQFWVGIHNQYDEQGKLKLSETYTMAGEPIEHTTSTNAILLN
ncbi:MULTISPECIES: toxin-antitoxin system YwqK family antitoxin [Shewanella]|uniref:toxin-antitoxin system YwqK family antitoxin n=1 Tax=Shewanella TaxID=22 RepID=UPI000D3D82BE|nr:MULTISPECIES: toxin-antitoxin system YwqK family antitoxin [Shewanella]MCI2965428.1 toxin-antitoxin system YwqK family antitoxin [Shewanella sp. N2AIL]